MYRLQVNSSALSAGSRSSCIPSAYRPLAGSCFSIDFFALQPTSRICDRLGFQLQTTYACACSNTHTHLDCSQLLQDVTHLGGQMFPCLAQKRGEVLFRKSKVKIQGWTSTSAAQRESEREVRSSVLGAGASLHVQS